LSFFADDHVDGVVMFRGPMPPGSTVVITSSPSNGTYSTPNTGKREVTHHQYDTLRKDNNGLHTTHACTVDDMATWKTINVQYGCNL
jgi:hypothetical protein